VKLVAILVWYDEDPQLLYDAVFRLGQIPVDALVAVDGAYALYPGGTGSSPPSNHTAIGAAARAIGISATIHSPARPWEEGTRPGDESGAIRQRTLSIRLAETLTDPDDWFLVLDADHVLLRVDPTFRQQLEASDKEVATYALVQRPRHASELSPVEREVVALHADEWPGTIDAPEIEAIRMLYRARRGLRYGPLHFQVTGPTGRLWGLGNETLLPAEDLTAAIVFEHAWERRTDDRHRANLEYYERRDDAGLEDPEVLAIARALKTQNAPRYLNEQPPETSDATA
jgi:hypothetical protein